ncbi:MAG: 5-bromo-4-chloroindolyl phosphate hydrolysis family protein [Bacteroidota bacterium]
MKKFTTVAGIISGIAAGLVMLGLFFLFHFSLVITAIITFATFLGIYVILFALRPKDQFAILPGNGITAEKVETVLRESEEKIRELERLAKQIRNENIRARIYHIITVVKKIYENIRKDPEKMKIARQFLSYYFDTSINIVKKYSQLSLQDVQSPEISKALLKAEDMLTSIDTAFDKQLAKLLSNDVMDLDVEIETLEKTFQAEDLK